MKVLYSSNLLVEIYISILELQKWSFNISFSELNIWDLRAMFGYLLLGSCNINFVYSDEFSGHTVPTVRIVFGKIYSLKSNSYF
jgi:hypothetical protein